jgi:hypothetical protein
MLGMRHHSGASKTHVATMVFGETLQQSRASRQRRAIERITMRNMMLRLVVAVMMLSATASLALDWGTLNVVFDGDSLTARNAAGTQDSSNGGRVSDKLAADHPTAEIQNFAVDGQRVDQIASDAASQIDSQIDASKTNILVVLIGTNNWNQSYTAAESYSALEHYWDDRIAAGWTVIALTIPDANLAGVANFRADYNGAIRSGYAAHGVKLLDLGNVGAFNDYTQLGFGDGVHFGSQRIIDYKDLVAARITLLLDEPISANRRINSGGNAANTFTADAQFSGGVTYSISTAIDTAGVTNPAPQAVYQSVRYGKSFSYTFSQLQPGAQHLVRLHFAETYWTAANGQPTLNNFDIVATAGNKARKAVVREVNVAANSGGQIVVTFTTVIDNAKVNGIEVIEAAPPAPTPTPTPVVLRKLTVSSERDFPAGSQVPISAPVAPPGYVFDRWAGDVEVLNNFLAPNTTATIPQTVDPSVTAKYKPQ